MNDQLRDLYTRHWAALEDGLGSYWGPNRDFSYPLLLKVPPAYERARTKLVIIGQQTSHWGDDLGSLGENPVQRLMSEYERFALGKWYRPTPFYQASYVLQMTLNSSGPAFGYMWTNLLKVDKNGKRPKKSEEDNIHARFPVVEEELRILLPNAVVFFTGPNYDDCLLKVFAGARTHEVEGMKPRELVRVEHEKLPTRSFRTYHPGHMAWNDAKTRIYERVMRKLSDCLLIDD